MSADPLAPFIPTGFKRAAPPERPEIGKPTGYRAFAVARGTAKPLRLELRCDGIAIARPYGSIAEILYDRAAYTGIWLQFPLGKIAITGTGLEPVVQAILDGTCEWLAELGEGETAPPGQPVITQIAAKAPTPAAKPAARPEGG